MVATEKGEYLTLEKPTTMGWRTVNIDTKETKDLELVKGMTEMRYIGMMDSQTGKGINTVNENTQLVFVKHEKLRDYENFTVFDMEENDDATDNIIATEWVPIKKEKHDGTKETKARLCLRGDMEKSLHKICRESPTINKMSLKILLSIAVSQGWMIKTCNVERAFLQLDQTQRGVSVKPPAELDLPKKRVLKTNKTAYPYPLKMDPALSVHKPKGQTMYDAATAIHADDSLIVDKKNIVEL